MDNVTNSIAAYVKEKGINISKMARVTGVPYPALYASLSGDKKKREIRGWELLAICKFLGVPPENFNEDTKN